MTEPRRAECPKCGENARKVKPVTLESLLTPKARGRLERVDGFRFCGTGSCDVVYFQPETSVFFTESDVSVPVFQKSESPQRFVCHCFEHTVAAIEDDVRRTGDSPIPNRITEKCRQGLDQCEEKNPQGACCLGNVRRVVNEAKGISVSTSDDSDSCCGSQSKSAQSTK